MTVERVNYFSGERLDAADLRLDQNYHIMVRRLVNRGFFSPGVVEGLTVTKSDPTHVTVAAGFALDPQGREIILTQDMTVTTPNKLQTPHALGYYLTIRYGESTVTGPGPDCSPNEGPPSRIEEIPILGWTELWPDPLRCSADADCVSPECAIVLAMVSLDQGCHIVKFDTTARQQAHTTLPGVVKSFQLEGEKDIAPDNGKTIHFNIRGGVPNGVILQLWSGPFSSLLYTELALHTHELLLGTGKDAAKYQSTLEEVSDTVAPDGSKAIWIDHTHPLGTMTTDPPIGGAIHNHRLSVIPKDHYPMDWRMSQLEWGNDDRVGHEGVVTSQMIESFKDVDHRHSILSQDTQGSNPKKLNPHKHPLPAIDTRTETAGNTGPAVGVPPYPVRDGLPEYSYLDSLIVKLDSQTITGSFIKNGWGGRLGDGTSNHGFVNDPDGTGPVRLSVKPGPHTIDLMVAPNSVSGGKVMWNLTVE
jgi:hypothetical protein